MIIFSQHCESMEYTVVDTGTTAAERALPDSRQSWDNCLFLLVGIQSGDSDKMAAAAKVIRRIGRMTETKRLVVNGFSGFAGPATRIAPELAQPVLTDLAKRLEERGLAVDVMPFGWNKRWRITVFDGVWAQRVSHI